MLFLLLLVVAVMCAGIYALRHHYIPRDDGTMHPTEAPGVLPANPSAATVVRPTFDIVRAEPDGSVIMAGRSEPGWSVSIQSGGRQIGATTADDNGEWIVHPVNRLPKGEYSLELRAQSPKGDRTLFSAQRLALSLSDPKVDQPLVALTEEGKSTRVLQMPQAGASEPAPRQAAATAGFETATVAVPQPDAAPPSPIGFASVDYEDGGAKSMLHMNGQGTPGTRVMLYVDNEYFGTATADATGTWSFSGNRVLSGGAHTLRADLLAREATKVVARAEVRFDRADGNQQALAEPAPKLAALGDRVPATKPAPVTLTTPEGGAIIVRRGDTLWQIAQRHYGDGAKYTQIFRNNRKQIRNPNLIYPSQRFDLPQ
ncbi:LysM peptidoglycan-binding domain-containing protein [Rhodomicrobium vannielii]|uniref:LysM peptidoglycan-binding domain-containing protein n=1 Tax=Rhodomicrobium vannielii TaxID=1069 RepID=UPI001AECC3A4|nr:LysM peptidoglycan-binding domain-containing protein [Rhodomicrobium vannielii]